MNNNLGAKNPWDWDAFSNDVNPKKYLEDRDVSFSVPVVGTVSAQERPDHYLYFLNDACYVSGFKENNGKITYVQGKKFKNLFDPFSTGGVLIRNKGTTEIKGGDAVFALIDLDRHDDYIRRATDGKGKRPFIAKIINLENNEEIKRMVQAFLDDLTSKYDGKKQELELQIATLKEEMHQCQCSKAGISLELSPKGEESFEEFSKKYKNQGLEYPGHILERFYLAVCSGELVILSGPPGTGKSSIVSALCGSEGNQMNGQMIQVQPGWTDQQDLLGYAKGDGNGFVKTDFLRALERAAQNTDKLFVICLDEMNLAPVEYYFASFLSIMQQTPVNNETRLLTLQGYENDGKVKISKNVRFVGTLNMDAYGKSLSPKVLSRAFTIEVPADEKTPEYTIYGDSIGESVPIDEKRFWDDELSPIIKDLEEALEVKNLRSKRLEAQVKKLCLIYNEMAGIQKKVLIDYILCSKILPNINTVSKIREIPPKANEILSEYILTFAKLNSMFKYAKDNGGVLTFFDE